MVNWIGLEVNIKDYTLGLSERRAMWLCNWFEKILQEGKVMISELMQALGRMQFAYGIIIWDRPFLPCPALHVDVSVPRGFFGGFLALQKQRCAG